MTKKLGRYELVEPLGQGGMGEVWLARLSGVGGFEKPAIVKTVLPALAKDSQFVERFHHEGKVLVHLSHSNIAQVYDLDQADGVLFMALEYVAGVDVSRLVSQVAANDELVPVPVAVYIAWQAAEGLSYAHSKAAPDGTPLAIIHRDVSPQNIMVSYEGEVKVIDFGISRSAARTHSTQAATVLGKLGYMAPEQALAEAVDARADQYSLAVLLWELLAGRHFVAAATTPEMMVAMAQPRRQPLAPLRSEVDPALDAVVQRALSPTPSDRYPTTDDFARALLAELNRLGQPTRKQVGDWVKLKCGEAYELNQRLLSRLSTLSNPPTTPQDPYAKTVASRAHPQATPNQPRPPVSTAAVLSAARPTRAPLIAAVLLAAGVVGSGAWFLTRGPAGPAQVSEPPPQPPALRPRGVEPPAPVVPVVPLAAATPDAGPPVQPPGETKAAPRAKGALSASLALVQLPKRAVRLKNTSGGAFTRCSVVIPGQRQVDFKSLPAGMSREINLDQFAENPAAPALDNQVRLTCAQGSITLPVE